VIYTLLNGIEFGIVLAFLVGPVFFSIIHTSIDKGFWVGVLVAVGVSISDLMYVLICYFGLSTFVTQPQVKIYMGFIGGAILLAFGAYYLFIKSRRKPADSAGEIPGRRKTRYLIKGFLINTMSPMVPLFWIGSVSMATLEFGYLTKSQFAVFFTGVLVTALATDIAKAYLAGRLRGIITPRILAWMNAGVGLVLIAFGGRLLLTAIQS